MTRSLKKGKRKRGISYPKRELEDMIDQGLTIREMADILGTDSLQSIRHAVERIQRDKEHLIELKMQSEMESRRKSINRVGIFRYSINDHNLNALEYILSRSQIGIKIINTPRGKAILRDPDFQNPADKLYGLGFYGRLCSDGDVDSSIDVLYVNIKGEETPPLKKLFTTIVKIQYNKNDADKIQALFFPYMENGSIYYQDVENIYFTKTADRENLLKSMQHEFNKSQMHIHLEYDPMIIAASGYLPLEIKGNAMEVISNNTEKNLDNIILREMVEQKSQISMETEMLRMQNFSRNDARSYAIMDQLGNMHMKITEEIPVFPTEDQRREIEKEAAGNSTTLRERIEQAFRHIDDLMKRRSHN